MKARDDQMVLCPCSGRYHVGIPRGHVFLVMGERSEPEGEREQLGYITRAALLMKEVEINMFGD